MHIAQRGHLMKMTLLSMILFLRCWLIGNKAVLKKEWFQQWRNLWITCVLIVVCTAYMCCGLPVRLEGPLRFSLSPCLHEWVDVGSSSTKKVNLSFSNENAMTDFLKTWYVGSGGHKYYTRGLSSSNAHLIPHLHICSDWLITKTAISRATELGMWVVMGTSTTQVVCCYWMRI